MLALLLFIAITVIFAVAAKVLDDWYLDVSVFAGESFRFQTLNDEGHPMGNVQTGRVKRIFRQGRQVCVEMDMPTLKCTHIYEAKRIYYKGTAATKGGGLDA